MVAVLLVLTLQSPAQIQRAAQSITPEDIRRRVGIIADDSMRGRDTPSPELEKTAAYLAREYRRFGLKPAGDNRGYLQRYALDRVQIVPESSAVVVQGPHDSTLEYGADFVFDDATFQSGDYAGELVLVTGPLSGPIGVDTTALAGKMLLVASRLQRPDKARLYAWKPAGVVLLSALPDPDWARLVARASRPQLRDPTREVGNAPVTISARLGALQPVLTRAGVFDFNALRVAGTFAVQPLGAVQLRVRARVKLVERRSAPNVVAILEGSDHRLKNEYVVFSAHMDHVGVAGPRGSGGCQAQGADSICNGADDDGSGTVAVVELAEAFARVAPRPKRSIVFLNVSGEEKGLWGSHYFSDHPTVAMNAVVANLNIDMIGRNWKDTIVAIGKPHSDLGATLDRVAAAHPELNMRPIDDIWPQENFFFRSDHYHFARKGVPILFFFSGTHEDYHRPGDEPHKIDAEKQSRLVRLIFYLGLEIANAPERPKWNPDSYRRIVSAN